MAKIRFGDVEENVTTREEWSLEKSRESLKDETIAVLGYGVQGPGQALNLKDNGFRVIVGQRKGAGTWEKALRDGWVEGENLFELEEAAGRGTIIQYLLSDAGQIAQWAKVKKHLTPGKCLYFSHGFAVTFKDQSGVIPPEDVDVVLIAPKGSGTSLRRLFLEGKGLNSSYAIFQDATGRARERVISLGIGVGFRLLVRNRFPEGSLFGLDRRTGCSDGCYCRGVRSAVQCAAKERTLAVRSVQRDGRRTDAEPHAAGCRKRNGLDVCQLLDNSPTWSSGLAA